MKIRESLRSSFKSLLHNKLRSFLTMLGVIIGIFSVIMLTSIGEGVKREVTHQIESLGTNLLYVLPGKIEVGMPKQGGSSLGVRNQSLSQVKSTLTYDDVLALKSKENINAATGVFNGIDRLDALNLLVATTGVDEDFIKISNLELAYGRFITQEEREKKARVVVIGDQVNKELFNGENSVGKSVRLNGKDYQVVGILKYKKPENMGPQSNNPNIKIYLPVTEIIDRARDKNIAQIIVQATSAQAIQSAEETIEETLKTGHSEEEFSVVKQQDLLDAINNVLGILTAAVGGIAAISLVVGGIGIMNIMLVSVTERTREIGIRKAIGAKRRDILAQFLIEAVVLSTIGGLLGLAAGIWGARALPAVFPTIHTAISVPAVVMALLFALFVGVFFGVYPAAKAAKLDPIKALRSE